MLKKTAQPPYWPKVKQGLQTLGLKPEIMSMLNSNKCEWGPAPASGDPNAAAYVSSEDANNDGKIDKIHFVINKFPPNASEEEIKYLVAQIAKTLVHEYGHIEDFDAEKGEFPGGEGVAEAAERAAEGMINQKLQLEASKNTTNKKNRIDNVIKLGSKGSYKMQSELVKLANHLDNIGHGDLADRLDSILKTAENGWLGPEGESDGETSAVSEDIEDNSTAAGHLRGLGYEVNKENTQALSEAIAKANAEANPEAETLDENGQPMLPQNKVLDRVNELLKELLAPQAADSEPVTAEASESVHDRINKLAELMSREFTTNVTGVFRR